jgi:5-methylcytosine-specific restriction endonuclease McrA
MPEKRDALEIAAQLRGSLLPAVTGPIRFKQLIAQDGEADGWYVTIATLDATKINVTLYLDRFGGTKERCYWFGFESDRRLPLNNLVKSLPARLRQGKEFHESDIIEGDIDTIPLSKSDFRHPVFEKLSGQNFFGIYDFDHLGREPNLHRAIDFLFAVLSAVSDLQIDGEADDYRSIENRRVVSLHLRRERDPELARKCKVRDSYRCQICSLKFEDRYGAIGKGFAEAHHKVPLSKLNGPVKNAVDALITVCANCHRMLHRMSGQEGDIAELRSTFINRRTRHPKTPIQTPANMPPTVQPLSGPDQEGAVIE